MNQEIELTEDKQHSDFVWTWKSSSRGAKASLWIPYFNRIEKVERSKNWKITYNGGELTADLSKVDFIMFYGATGDIPLEFLDDLSQNRIVGMIHRRNQSAPYMMYTAGLGDDLDIVSKQIAVRRNLQKRAYVARSLIHSRISRMKDVISVSESTMRDLSRAKTISQIRSVEAQITAYYWKMRFEMIGVDEVRRSDGPIASALDAGSKFLMGIVLRWVLFHKMLPTHGFLHEPTSYPSLVYDLMEPYRYIFENAAFEAWRKKGNSKQLVGATLSTLKDFLDTPVYVPATLQMVRRKNLLHGAVLALRAYLLGEVPRLVLPVEGIKKGGRPPNSGYKLPGEMVEKRRIRG